MSFTTYKQADSRWGKKNYNGSSSMATAGCGPTACAMIAYGIDGKTTPLDTMKYMQSHGYAIRNNGTAWAGIPACLKAFGLQNVQEVVAMSKVWELMSKGYVGVFLFRAGSRGGVTWTTAGHYIAVTGYKYENGKHYIYTRDSGGRNHTGWYAYETTMKGLIPKIWLGSMPKSTTKSKTTKKSASTSATTQKYTGTMPSKTIKKDSTGTDVIRWQRFLKWMGYSLKDDGDFGGITEGFTKECQKKLGFTGKDVDGIVGAKTIKKAKEYKKPIKKTTASTSTTSTSTSNLPMKCIDVSYWQGKISLENWKKIKKSCGYAICRASYTSQSKFALSKDSTFDTNFKNAKAAGLKVGAYHYSQAITVDEAKKEAKYLCDILKNYKVDFYVVCDFEYGGRLSSKIGKKASDIANAFCDIVKANGYEPCIYANTSTLNSNLTNPKYPVWVAQYSSNCTYKGKKVMWQYTSSGRVDGISASNTNNGTNKVDLSHVYTVPTIKPIPQSSTTTKTKTETKKETKKETKAEVKKETKKEPAKYTGKIPTENNNAKIINGLAYRMCYPYGTSQKKYTFKNGKPKQAYKEGIDKAYPNHKNWPNKRQKVGACCDVFVGTCLGLIGISVSKDLKNQLIDMPKMTSKLKSNGHYKASDFKLGDIVQRGRKNRSGHTYVICELINGKRYIANSHYKHLKGCYAVMDSTVKTESPSAWKYYKCYTVQGAYRTYYKKGDYGYDVLYIQKFLNWYGISCTADGDYGAKTAAAVSTFQEAMGLIPDGMVGKKTIEFMKQVKK